VVDCGALDALVICLEEFDPGVKESAAWALGYIARHNTGVYTAAVCGLQSMKCRYLTESYIDRRMDGKIDKYIYR